jgi:ring-1,2-phenylacetyl-CoA epoxidase subunit PaaD
MVTASRGATRAAPPSTGTGPDTGAGTGPGTGTGHLGAATPLSSTAAPDGEPLTALERELLHLAGQVPDPELPMISLADLGVLRGLHVTGPGRVQVEVTPTWTGCPALETMAADITGVLTEAGMSDVAVRTVLSPAWTSDAITAEGRRKLTEAGVAPPRPQTLGGPPNAGPVAVDLAIHCPHCGSTDTRLLNRFSSTACKSLRRCESCREPFDHFKEV